MRVDNRESKWEVDRKVAVKAYAVNVEGWYFGGYGVCCKLGEELGIDWC